MGRHVPNNETLCNICSKVDLSQLRLQQLDTDNPETGQGTLGRKENDLGYVDEIIQSGDCTLCRLATKALSMSWTTIPTRTRNGEQIRCALPYTGSSRRRVCELEIKLDIHRRELDLSHRRIQPSTIRLADIDISRVVSEGGVVALGRTYNADCCDRNFIAKSYRHCIESHGRSCDAPFYSRRRYAPWSFHLRDNHSPQMSAVSEHLHFIDVQENCIRQVPSPARWLTLSYVWGQSSCIQLEKSNFEELTTPGALNHIRLPKTIKESMEVVQRLGERYLWVDMLCIVQDDKQSKRNQIDNMGIVYGFSSLTIVAASGEDAESGLAGWQSGSRCAIQYHETVQGLKLLAMGPTLASALGRSVWSTRAWTYQESILSKRMLVFTPQQVFFYCAAEPVTEDSLHYDLKYKECYYKSPHMRHDAFMRDPHFKSFPWKDSDEIKNRGLLEGKDFGSKDLRDAYQTLIEEYSCRSLTYPADILNAVSGVLRMVPPFVYDNYCCGLPESHFDWALLWQPMGPLHRRNDLNFAGQSFPSWSWTGWQGPIGYVGDLDVMREIKSWTCISSQGNSEPWIILATREQAHEERSTLDDTTFLDASTPTGNHGHGFDTLCFTTRSARFRVHVGKGSSFGAPGAGHLSARLINQLGVFRVFDRDMWIGCIILEHQFALTFQEPEVEAEFIILSKYSAHWSIGAFHAETSKRKSISPYDTTKLGLRTEANRERINMGLMYNVMWIRNEEKVSYRVALGQIHMDAWDNSNWIKKDVILR